LGLKGWLEDLHQIFIGQVKDRRGPKLSDNPELFTGEVFIGQKALDEGLVDGIAHLVPEMKKRYGDKVRFRRFGRRRSLVQRLGARVMGDALNTLEERAEFARFGL